MQNYDVYIFTEGGSKIGLGHITRCIALYDEIERRGKKAVFVVSGDSLIEDVLGSRVYILDNWYENCHRYLTLGNIIKPFCIIDSYLAEEKVYNEISRSCEKAVYIDDTNRISYPEGIIVNPSIYGDRELYQRENGQIYLTGSEYVILRERFRIEYNRKIMGDVENILVIIGGSDICNITPSIIKIISSSTYNHQKKHIVVGKGFNNINSIIESSRFCPNISMYYNLAQSDLCELMQKCDLAVTAAGQTVYELIAVQVPFICIQIAHNQINNIKGLLENRIICDYLDYTESVEYEALKEFIDKGILSLKEKSTRKRQVESMKRCNLGKGVERIVNALLKE